MLMGLFDKAANAQIETWLETATMAEIEDMEKQGLDVAAWKTRVAERDAAEAAAKIVRRNPDAPVDNSKLRNPIDLGRLVPYKATPRDASSDFVKAVAGKLPLLGKAKHLQKACDGMLLYASVVQANNGLWRPGDYGDCPAVLVFATDEAHRCDVAWLKKTAAAIADMKHAASVPADCQKMIALLRDDQSDFCCKLGPSVNGGAEGWCAVYVFARQDVLPKKCLPSEGLVPFVLKDGPEENVGVRFFDIPGSYYEA